MDNNQRRKELEEWLLQLIDKFRAEYNKVIPQDLGLSNTDDYREPCQIEVFWLNGHAEGQIVLTTHQADRKDKEIIVNGPYVGKNFIEEIEKIIKQQRWDKKIPEDSSYAVLDGEVLKYSDILAGIVRSFKQMFKDCAFKERKMGENGGEVFVNKNGWVKYIVGNICDTNVDEKVKKVIDEAKNKAMEQKKKLTKNVVSSRSKDDLTGFGTSFYPIIWIGEKPKKTFIQRVNNFLVHLQTKHFDTMFNKVKVVVESDGFVGLITDSKINALRIMNTIFGISLLEGISCFAVRESELYDIRVKQDSLKITSRSGSISSLRTSAITSFQETYVARIGKHYSVEKIKKIIEKAAKVERGGAVDPVLFFLEGFTYFHNSEYSQSFIMNWVIIEKYINAIWNNFMKEKNFDSERIKKFTNKTGYVTLDHLIEILHINSKIKKIDYGLFMDLKRKRNRFIHSGTAINKATSESALNVSYGIVINEFVKFDK